MLELSSRYGLTTALLVVGVTVPTRTAAQVLDVLHVDDFIAPSTISAVGNASGQGHRFFASIVSIGAVRNYQLFGFVDPTQRALVSSVTNFYVNRFQFGIEGALLSANSRPTSAMIGHFEPDARWRVRPSVAVYAFDEKIEPGEQWSRLQLSALVGGDGSSRDLGIAADLDVQIPIGTGIGEGGFIVAWWPDSDEAYYGLAYRYDLAQPYSWLSSKWGVGYGYTDLGESSGSRNRHTLKAELQVIIAPLLLGAELRVVGTAFRGTRTGHNTEVAAFVSVPVLSTMF